MLLPPSPGTSSDSGSSQPSLSGNHGNDAGNGASLTGDNGNVFVDGSTAQSICQKLYLESGNSKNLLLTMCIGLSTIDADGKTRKLADLSLEPYASSKEKKSFKYTNEMLCQEVIRRATICVSASKKSVVRKCLARMHGPMMSFIAT